MNQATTKSGMATKQSLECQIPLTPPLEKGDLEGFLFRHCEAQRAEAIYTPPGLPRLRLAMT